MVPTRQNASPNRPRVRIGKQLGDLSDASLRFYRQIGVEDAGLPGRYVTDVRRSRPLVPPAQEGPAGPLPPPWSLDDLRRMRERVDAFGMAATTIGLPLSGNVLLGRPERDADLATIRQNVRTAGQAGLRVLTYSFTALRASAGYFLLDREGRGGAHLRAFDARRAEDLPVIPTVGTHTREQMWERLEYFLRAVVPAAEDAGVKLALHPNDPPVEVFRGVAQPVRSLADLERQLDVVDSPANCLFLDTGVLTEMGEDAPAAIHRFGARGRIATVHFRNVRVQTRYTRYVETFHDEGDCDMAACMRAFVASGYDGAIDPDHSPGIEDDSADSHKGWAFAIGQLIGLRTAALELTPSSPASPL